MTIIMKNQGQRTKAYRLGACSAMEQKMIKEGKIRLHGDGRYEIFSQEAVNGSGEFAKQGDYFKIDSSRYPYPNKKEWFEAHHQWIGDDEYVQVPQMLEAWEAGEAMTPTVEYLIRTGQLTLNTDDPDRYFEAELWGSGLTASQDALVVIYEVTKDHNGEICYVNFNFLARSEFEKTYHYIQ